MKNGIMDYAGYRYTVIEEKIEECLEAARNGEDSVSINPGDLTEDELAYLEQEVHRRIESGNY